MKLEVTEDYPMMMGNKIPKGTILERVGSFPPSGSKWKDIDDGKEYIFDNSEILFSRKFKKILEEDKN